MTYKQTMSITAIMMAVCICSLGCASRSVRMDGRGECLLEQARDALTTSFEKGAGVPIEVKGWGVLKPLPSALEKRGYSIVRNRPAYSVEADFKIKTGPGMGGLIVWDVLMAIPSLVLPVPIMGSYAWKLEVTIFDGASGNVLSQIEKTVNYRLTGYSLWGFMLGMGNFQDDLVAVTATLSDEELKKLVAKSGL